ncbi:MAG: hypothetical protein IAF58_07810 [Leptolyngbya sp.]|nr:hypothetical protein [Candidatus Melainabacteria bacterium]
MSPEDKGSTMDPYDNAGSGKAGEENSSLSARRARLRGSLSKAATPPDPYAVSALGEPPLPSTATLPDPASVPAVTPDSPQAPAIPDFLASDDAAAAPKNGGSLPQIPDQTPVASAPSASPSTTSPNLPSQTTPASSVDSLGADAVGAASAALSAAMNAVPKSEDRGSSPLSTLDSLVPKAGKGASKSLPNLSQAITESKENQPSYSFGLEELADSIPSTPTPVVAAATSITAPISDPSSAEGFSTMPQSGNEPVSTLESSIAAASPGNAKNGTKNGSSSTKKSTLVDELALPAAASVAAAKAAADTQTASASSSGSAANSPMSSSYDFQQQMAAVSSNLSSFSSLSPVNLGAPAPVSDLAQEILTNIDQGLNACAMNLASIQKLAGEQTETMKSLSETMQNQTFAEINLTLNSLMDSLSAALEPMKAVGELVPAIDQLVQSLEAKHEGQSDSDRMSPEQLVMSLADQLSAGLIDPWTFKSAYMAVYPEDHPADLLHRLVDLLGTQKLSGELFRAAYDAVQGAEAPPRSRSNSSEDGGNRGVQDEAVFAEIDKMRQSQDELMQRFEQREREMETMLNSKESELEEQKLLLGSRWEEFNSRYDELSETLSKRDELLEVREQELSRKDSENANLKAQLEELRDQTKEMVTDFQRQMVESNVKAAEAQAQVQAHAQAQAQAQAAPRPQSFFDVAPAQPVAPSLFDAAPPKPLDLPVAQQQQQQMEAPTPPGAPPSAPSQAPAPAPAPPPAPMPAPMPAPPPPPPPPPPSPPEPSPDQAIPRAPATTPFMSGAGSYGSGVRAQVFEVIVRQALAGAPWREICAGPMQVNNITPDEVESEVKRRQALLKK